MDSGTSIGVFIEEAQEGIDRADFIQRYSIANKEAFKTNYWIRLVREGGLVNERDAQSLLDDCEELQRMLISAIKKSKGMT
jgi:four helix bundle protein